MNRPMMAGVVTLAGFLLATSTAHAHSGSAHVSGFLAGLSHPYSGLDHVLVMLAVGCFAARQGGRATWLIPSLFIGAMLVGGVAGVAELEISFAEFAIALSVVLAGLTLAIKRELPATAVIAVVAGSAVLHGYAHGAEMPPDASGSTYSMGFIIATSTLLCMGIGIERAIGRLTAVWSHKLASVGGGLIAVAGLASLIGIA